ncbi:hypothetical protein BDW74DRAFT_175527 [Aspergillus multicolor]|uniref:uncharacterized protein n=1 Tax=Aspergillus multicolor TaxID=41759 RepID=UPI003CCD39CF
MANRIQRAQTYVTLFADHKGHAACLVFRGRASSPLPPLYGFAIYFTHPDASPENVDPEALFNATKRPSGALEIRLDLFFLPNATVEECTAHYNGEKVQRGDYRAQVTAVESDATPPPTADESSTPRLPGFVPSYIDYFKTYHGVLFLCTERDWRLGKREMCRVLFDPCSDEEWANWREELDPEVQPATHLKWFPLDEDSSATSPPFRGSVSQEMHFISNLQRNNVTSEPYHEALEKGWTRWP